MEYKKTAVLFIVLYAVKLGRFNQSINTRISIAQNKQSKMSSNALSVIGLEKASFQLFSESVTTHSSSVGIAGGLGVQPPS